MKFNPLTIIIYKHLGHTDNMDKWSVYIQNHILVYPQFFLSTNLMLYILNYNLKNGT